MKDLRKVHDLTGQKFGRLTVLGIDRGKETRKTYWICQCDCGNIISARSDALIGSRTKSCGCYKREVSRENVKSVPAFKKFIENGMKVGGTRLYSIWTKMKQRCSNQHDTRYCDYGARGITVCKEWDEDFIAFYTWATANGYSDELSIDRINNDGNYEPSNCRWVTNKTQSNNRRTNIKITIGNATKTLTEWCAIFEVPYSTVHSRYVNGGHRTLEDLFNR